MSNTQVNKVHQEVLNSIINSGHPAVVERQPLDGFAFDTAKRLVDKFYKITGYNYAKLCALSCVEEIVKELIAAEVIDEITGIDDKGHITARVFWASVVSYINKI